MSPRRFRPPALYTKSPFLRSILDGMPESVKIIDDKYRLVYANKTSEQNLKTNLNELRGRSCHEAFYGFKEKCFFCGMQKVFDNAEPSVGYFTTSINGVNRDFEVSVFPLAANSKKVDYAVEIVRDITPVSKGNGLPQNAGKISSRDKNFAAVFDTMAQWADDDRAVLVQGEKGTGKKSFARALHQRSARSERAFRVFNCVDNSEGECCDGLFGPDGAWEKAKGGTLYLDGICRLGAKSQLMLAEKISRPADWQSPRVIAATSQDILQLVQEGQIKPELYNQFASRVLRLPALRDRKQDLPFLAQHFIETYKVITGSPAEKLGSAAMCQLMTYGWPGNIRELESQIERACLLASGPQIDDLSLPISAPSAENEKLDDLLETTEKAYLVDALTKSNGRLVDTAKQSGLTQKTLQRKMKKYGLKSEDFKNLSNGPDVSSN
ncbi:MAG TPA: sigma 54-interacting transcriptional regulator [bacterium]|nr:sigma 54-interacting transcriptional regulator [bacterium]